ncbi:hypothetical protein Q7689_00875 [Nocardiopsis tropica]|uniref:hypothetical protein n=1 Tax=Nocardiopsis tropica TaxID=109330 RepID=UPI002E88C64B|nr:hypothetical protein [Nocardiopsis tropica]
MAQSSWPSPAHNSRNVTDTEYEILAARFSDDGLIGDPGDSAAVLAGTGLQVLVRANKFGSLRGHAWSSGTTDVPLAIAPNSSGQTRVDRVVLALDRATWTVRAVVSQGTAGGGAPALVRDATRYEIPLGRVTVPTGAASVTVAREELYIGSRVRPSDSTTANPTPALGELGFERDTGRLRMWDGAARRLIYEDTGDIALPVGFDTWVEESGGKVGRKIGSLVQLVLNVRRVRLNFPASDADGSKLCNAIPSVLRPEKTLYFPGAFTGGTSARLEVRADGEIWVNHQSATVTVGRYLRATLTYLKP